ncbi:hypothetical protein Pcinc_017389 [Petrolisthes cinctipes]|uniref:Uncharacterized protein n=1 Tax=Petrolisthes cinctipes TaxID=88211 RepID=A0AAE1FQS1_PETCI|nr:hypothetical protein Pcinc_017389 [Petrolisthes cinctipes]
MLDSWSVSKFLDNNDDSPVTVNSTDSDLSDSLMGGPPEQRIESNLQRPESATEECSVWQPSPLRLQRVRLMGKPSLQLVLRNELPSIVQKPDEVSKAVEKSTANAVETLALSIDRLGDKLADAIGKMARVFESALDSNRNE